MFITDVIYSVTYSQLHASKGAATLYTATDTMSISLQCDSIRVFKWDLAH
jgi:hypothetical protein